MIALRLLQEDEYAAWDAAHRAEYARGLIEKVGIQNYLQSQMKPEAS